MADTSAKKTNFVSRVVNATNSLLDAIEALEKLSQEGAQLGYVSAPGSATPGSLKDVDFVGENVILSAQAFANVMATLQALDQDVHANNGAILSSLYQVRK